MTFRGRRRTVGETHARWERTGGKRADVVVRELEQVDPGDGQALLPYRELSGFAAVEEWQAAIKELHGGLEPGWLYDVVVVGTEDDVERHGELGYEHAGVWECGCGERFVVTDRLQPMRFAVECPDHPLPADQ